MIFPFPDAPRRSAAAPFALFAALFLGAIIAASLAAADEAAPQPAARQTVSGEAPSSAAATNPPHPLPAPAVTSHVVDLPGRSLHFKAIAGAIRLSDSQTGEPQADIGYVAYVIEGGDPAKRPISFIVNGGPGAASAWLDLGMIGPWRVNLSEQPHSPSAPPITIDNADTWLDFTDLVFIDPPGTGYSRILSKSEAARHHLYSVEGDIEALSVVIRKWLGANKRLESPKFIAGESYGGFRAPKLARRLQDTEGVGVNGLVLISPVIDFAWFEGTNNPLPFVTHLPSLAAAARGLTGADARQSLADVEAYAAGPYLTDLVRGERDPAALARIIDNVTRITGLDPAFVRRLGGRIDPLSFARERGRAEGKVSSRYDSNVSAFDPFPHSSSTEYSDPILDADKTPLASAMADITANRLGWPIDARYEILNESVNRQWDWDGKRDKNQSLSDLKQALAIDQRLRVLVMHGLTDQVTPYFASKLLIDQIPPFGDPDRITLKVYDGGHMPYLRDQSRAAMREDARKLIEGK